VRPCVGRICAFIVFAAGKGWFAWQVQNYTPGFHFGVWVLGGAGLLVSDTYIHIEAIASFINYILVIQYT
jgi:hypothetical protein